MADSNTKEQEGQELIDTIVQLTGLPQDSIRKELKRILQQNGHQDGENVTMDQLRRAMMTYLESVQADMLSEASGVKMH